MPSLALYRAHFAIGNGVQLELECVKGKAADDVLVPGVAALVSASRFDDECLEMGVQPPMCWRERDALFEPFQLREDTDYFVDVTVPLPLSQAEHLSRDHAAWPFMQRLASSFTREPVKRWRQTEMEGRLCTVVTGMLRLRSHAGVLDFATSVGGAMRAEVVCRKLDYFEEFKALLDGLAEKATELLLAYDTPVSLTFGLAQEQAGNDAALHFLMRYVMLPEQLPAAIAQIVLRPHARLVETLAVRPLEELEAGDAEAISDHSDFSSMALGGPFARFFGGYTPRELPHNWTQESHDTVENRYAKGLLEHCYLLAQRLERRMAARNRFAAVREAGRWARALDEMLRETIWRDVGPLGQLPSNSQTLLHRPGYKELFRLDLALRMSLDLSWSHGAELADGLLGDVRPINQIYEYWCFFVLRELMQGLCGPQRGGNFLTVTQDGLRVQLVKGLRSECRFLFPLAAGSALKVSLFYNRRFVRPRSASTDWSGSYTAAFDPDYSILVRTAAGGSHWLHFDAKYRLERQEAEALFGSDADDGDNENPTQAPQEPSEYEAELVRVHKQDDLFKMHTYRDGILSTRGAYVLFPGDGVGGQVAPPRPNFFVRHPSAIGVANRPFPSVGAFPLRPNGSGAQAQAVGELLRLTLNAIAAGAPYVEETGWTPGSASTSASA